MKRVQCSDGNTGDYHEGELDEEVKLHQACKTPPLPKGVNGASVIKLELHHLKEHKSLHKSP